MRNSQPKTNVLNVNLFGPFGAGKGTQAQALIDRFGLSYFVAGEQLKEEIRKKTKLGKRVEKIVRAGRLVPDEIIAELLDRLLKKIKPSRGIVVDGSPRKLTQKKLIDAELKRAGRVPINILIDIPERESLRRLSKRKICVACTNKPLGRDLRAAECRKCGGRLVRRYDDEPEIIAKRLKVYKREVLPVIQKYKKEGNMIRINGNQSRAGVTRDLMRVLATLGYRPTRPRKKL